MNDDLLITEYSFAEGEYISKLDVYHGVGFDGFTMTTNFHSYPHILGTGGWAQT